MRIPFDFTVPFLRVPIFSNIGLANVTLPNKWIRPFLRQYLLVRDGVFVDIGANIGEMLVHAKHVDPKRVCLAVEPNPTCVDYLYRLVRAKHWSDVTIVPAAAAGDYGLSMLHLFHPIDTDASASLDVEWLPSCTGARVVMRFPAAVLQALVSRIAMVLIDVEGQEVPVIDSLMPVIASHQAPVILETFPTAIMAARHRAMEAVLEQWHYAIHRIDPVSGQTSCVERFPEDGDESRKDFLLLPV